MITGFRTAIPWESVEDSAIIAADCVERGWTDTCDAGGKVERTSESVG